LGWADGGVAALRQKKMEEAATLLARARTLAPDDPRVIALEATRLELAGDAAGAIAAFEKAGAIPPGDVRSLWSAARLASALGDAGRALAMRHLEAALALAPANLFLLARVNEIARAQGDAARAAEALDRISRLTAGDPKLDEALAQAKAAQQSGDAKTAGLKATVVENLLKATPRYQQARRDVEPGVVGLPLETWTPALEAAMRVRMSKGVDVRFAPLPAAALASVSGAAAVRAAGKEARDLAFAGPAGVRVATAQGKVFRAGNAIPGSTAADLVVADVTNSGEPDLVTPGALWVRDGDSYRKVALPAGEKVAVFDVDADGDLDLYISSSSGDHLMRNNLDGTWTDVTEASGLPKGIASRSAVPADVDRDGDVDLLLLTAGRGFALYDNLRGGRLALREAGLPGTGSPSAAAFGDLDGDGRVDLVWTEGGRALRSLNRGDGTFGPPKEIGPGEAPLLFDYDNDGALDLFLANPRDASTLWRNDGTGAFSRADAGPLPPASDAEAVDFDRDGDLDLVLVTPAGGAVLYENRGGNANGWIDVALEGLPTGSAKVNRLGYGSEIEAKAQDLYVYRTASRPVTHLGLGPRRKVDVLRVVWTNGIPQNALDPATRTLLREVQQLKGSCPFLYAFDGERWHFVSDVLGRAPAGLLYDGVHQAAADTREWLVVPGRMLAPSDGRLTLDFTEELWEAASLDLVELKAVDHPAGTEIVADEKMVPPPFPEKKLFIVSRARTPRARDGQGRDRTAEIASQDGIYVAGFAPTRYQGIVQPRVLELELPDARAAQRVRLYLTGWIFYSDTSINVSLSQRRDLSASPPLLEVPDGKGGWRVALASMGYPAGKTKTMPLDLSQILNRADPRVRISTNLAISWDRIVYTVDEEDAPLTITDVPLVSAELFFRGFSRRTRETPDGPDVFVHDDVSTEPRWADMAGLYTRFGDVRRLMAAADDRYAILKGGDAVRLAFDARGLPPVAPGYVRDWLFVSDGWDKDGDKNTVAGQTVEPLPFHGMDDSRYGALAFPDSDAHRAFAAEYLTRRGGPEEFRDAVRNARNGERP
jgi:FG-GAP-like repeat